MNDLGNLTGPAVPVDHLVVRIALALPRLAFDEARRMAELARHRGVKAELALMAARAAGGWDGYGGKLDQVERRYGGPHPRTVERTAEMAGRVAKMGGDGDV